MDQARHSRRGYRVTRTALACPEEPEDPGGQLGSVVPPLCGWSSEAARRFIIASYSDPTALAANLNPVLALTRTSQVNLFRERILLEASKAERPLIADDLLSRMNDAQQTLDRVIIWAEQASQARYAARRRFRISFHLPQVPPHRLLSIAVFLAGHKRADAIREEWRDHLSGTTGQGFPVERQAREAAGFVCAAVRYRLQDAADLAWRPVDAALASRELSNLIVMVTTLSVAVISIHGAGVYGLVSNLSNVAVAWVATYGLIRVGRWWRDVRPPERKPRRSKELVARTR